LRTKINSLNSKSLKKPDCKKKLRSEWQKTSSRTSSFKISWLRKIWTRYMISRRKETSIMSH